MPRRVQDIIPADRRSIKSVPLRGRLPSKESIREPARKKREIPEDIEVKDGDEVEVESVPLSRTPKSSKETKKEITKEMVTDEAKDKTDLELPILRVETPVRRMPVTPPISEKLQRKGFKIGKWPFITVGLLLVIVVIGYFASAYYSQATFTIIPKVIPVAVNSTYVAQGTPQSTDLYYTIVTLNGAATTTVMATNGPVTNTKATGKVTFYNASSTSSVRMIAGSKLSNDSGLIYRLTSSVVIPGLTKVAGEIIPGKVSASVIASDAGQDFNIMKVADPVPLRIVAYKGTSKYDTIYAKPVAGISGGFVGVKKIVNPNAVASSTVILTSQITTTLINTLKSSIPADSIMYDKSYVVLFGAPVIGGTSSTSATVSLQGTIYGITFPKTRFIETVAKSDTVSLFGKFAYTTPGLDSLDVSITNLKDFSPTKKLALVIHATGNMKLIGTIPVSEIEKKLAGTSLASTQDLFKSYSPVIQSGSGELAPPWAKIPTDLSRIKVIVQNP